MRLISNYLLLLFFLLHCSCLNKKPKESEGDKKFNSIHEERYSNITPQQIKTDFTLLNLRTLKESRFDSLNDSLIIISFWEYYCKPCIEELPTLIALKNKLEVRSCRLMLISEQYPNKVLESIIFKNDTVDFFHVSYNKYDSAFDNNTSFIPRTYFVDKTTNFIFYHYMGGVNYNDSALVNIINQYYSKKRK